jgi:CRP/FNR family cyclic AMP-dependent transcriptional regulator
MNSIREDLLLSEGVQKHVYARRASTVFAVGDSANHVYYLESGLVKLEKPLGENRDLLLTVVSAGEIFGEQGILGEGTFDTSAKVLQTATVYSLPTDSFLRFCDSRPEAWRVVVGHFLQRKHEFENKVKHLCHSDVRQRLIYYLEKLARLSSEQDTAGTVIHISQNEMASLVGATRETTSTTLNALSRQGLITLGHRMVMIPSLESLRDSLPSSKVKAASSVPQL